MISSKIVRFLAAASLAAGFATAAHAQATRTWVSGVGDDVNPCSRTAPCKTFAGAISKTAEGGEIDALDPAGYGGLTVTKAITVDGGTGSGWASDLNAGTVGFTINVTGGTHVNDAVVILRNITWNGASQSPTVGATHAINYVKAAQLIVENCVMENQGTTGINMNMTTTGTLRVEDCYFDNVNTAALVQTSAGQFAAAHFDNCRFNADVNGINASSNAIVHIRNCNFAQTSGGTTGAVRSAAGCQVNISNSTFSSNVLAVNAAGGVVRVTNNDFIGNSTAIAGSAESANNNRFRANNVDGTTTNVFVVK